MMEDLVVLAMLSLPCKIAPYPWVFPLIFPWTLSKRCTLIQVSAQKMWILWFQGWLVEYAARPESCCWRWALRGDHPANQDCWGYPGWRWPWLSLSCSWHQAPHPLPPRWLDFELDTHCSPHCQPNGCLDGTVPQSNKGRHHLTLLHSQSLHRAWSKIISVLEKCKVKWGTTPFTSFLHPFFLNLQRIVIFLLWSWFKGILHTHHLQSYNSNPNKDK